MIAASSRNNYEFYGVRLLNVRKSVINVNARKYTSVTIPYNNRKLLLKITPNLKSTTPISEKRFFSCLINTPKLTLNLTKKITYNTVLKRYNPLSVERNIVTQSSMRRLFAFLQEKRTNMC